MWKTAPWNRAWVGIGVPVLIGLVHVALIAPHYQVGSFDDDSSYILSAQALLTGHGLTGLAGGGQAVVALYPPGYSALLVPLLWLWPHSYLPMRLLSAICYAGVFPLTWIYLARRQVSEGVRAATLLLLALGPTFATFGSMVMAETPYLVLFLLMLLVLDRWQEQDRTFTWAALGTVAAAAGLVWLKEAGIALVGGLVLWMLFKRWRKGLTLGIGIGLTLVPVLVARLMAHVALVGSRYSDELGGYYSGGLVNRLVHVLPSSTHQLFSTAIPATLLPYFGNPLPHSGGWATLSQVLSWHLSILVVIGAVRWWRRYRDATVWMVAVYLLESVLYPFVNERRAILVLPVLVVWYVMGAVGLWQALRWAGPRIGILARTRRAPVIARRGAAVLAAVFVVVPAAVQLPRDYLFGWGQNSSQFQGSRYTAILSHLGSPSDVVETDYLSSAALFTGHTTRWTAFTSTMGLCYLPGIESVIKSDNASYLLVGDLNKPNLIDDMCLYDVALFQDWSVPLLHTGRDDATVFELIGPGTGNPDLSNLLTGAVVSQSIEGTTSSEEWDFAHPGPVSQVSVGQAAAPAPADPAPANPSATSAAPTTSTTTPAANATTAATSVALQLRRPDGTWLTVAHTDRPSVGDQRGAAPYLLADESDPVQATAMRVVITGPDVGLPAIGDPSALGPTPATPGPAANQAAITH